MTEIQLKARHAGGYEEQTFIDVIPDKCPLCHVAVTPIDLGTAVLFQRGGEFPCLERLFRCPNRTCTRLFIARYFRNQPNNARYYFETCVPVEPRSVGQSATISRVSPDFCAIYEEAFKAEQCGLLLVAGPGYRKALEFLIKDYIIGRLTETDAEKLALEKAKAEKTLLGTCIKDYVKSEQIKEIAKRAAWLGNDETHYVRKWEDKDLKDLKKLISLTLHWIEVETLTLEVIADMPEGKP